MSADAIWLRYLHDEGRYTFRNWGRGVTWFLMGLAATLSELRRMEMRAPDLESAWRAAAELVRSYQRHDGLWNGFLDDPGSTAETSGSAGIAVALALGLRDGILASDYIAVLRRARQGLTEALTPDGLMRMCSQRNTAGEAFQREYRILAMYPAALYAWSGAVYP